MNALLQYPGTFCGLLTDPTDAFLYSRINAGNCVSLPLNKGYGGVGGDINLKYIFEKLFNDTYGGGYPETRKEFQADLRKILNNLSLNAHKSMEEIVDTMDETILKKALLFPGIRDMIEEAPEGVLKKKIKEWYEKQ